MPTDAPTLQHRLLEAREAMREGAKRLVYRFEFTAVPVRALRAARVDWQYRRLCNFYSRRPASPPAGELLEQRNGAALAKLRSAGRRPRFLFLGTDYEQDMSGMLQALQEVGDVTTYKDADGKHPYITGLTGVETASARIREYADMAAAKGEPFDILIGQMWGGLIRKDLLAYLRQQHGMLVINICMDDRHAYDNVRKAGVAIGTRLLHPEVDLVLTAAPEAVGWHLKEGCPAFFFPEASSSEVFALKSPVDKKYDVGFVGASYGIRRTLVQTLQNAGIDVQAYGNGWPDGRLPWADTATFFAQCRIVLGVGTIGNSNSFCGLKLRDFDAPMSGSFYLTTRNADLNRLFDVGQEIATYDTIADCVAKTRYYLDHPEEREAIAARGHARVKAEHQWRHRFEWLMEVLAGRKTGD